MGEQKQNCSIRAIELDDRLLVPEEHFGERPHLLAKMLASKINQPNAEKDILRILQLFVVDDDLSGLAFFVDGKTLLYSVLMNITGINIDPDQKEFVEKLDVAIASEPVLLKFCELSKKPKKDSFLAYSHLNLLKTTAYPIIIQQMQSGIIEALVDYDWQPRENQIESVLQGFVRVTEILTEEEAILLLQYLADGELDKAISFIEKIASERLTYANDKTTLLPNGTQATYCWGFEKVIVRKNPICPVLATQKNRETDEEEFSSLDDDDAEENSRPGDPYNSDVLDRIEREVAHEVDPQGGFETVLDALVAEREPGSTYQSGDFATLSNFQTDFDRRIVHAAELAWFLKELGGQKSTSREYKELKCALSAIPMTGRSLQFFLNVTVGEFPKTIQYTRIQDPIFDPIHGIILFTPEAYADIPMTPQHGEDEYCDVFPFSVLPIPPMLLRQFRSLSEGLQRGEKLFRVVERQRALKALRNLSERFLVEKQNWEKKQYFTEARLRRTFSALFIVRADLNRVLATIISDQRTASLRPHMFYITVELSHLADRYDDASKKIWNYLRKIEPKLNEYYPMESRPETIPHGYIGSGYLPKIGSVKRVVMKLFQKVQEAETDEDKWNANTLLTIYLLSVVCGLRISEAAGLKVGQFDLKYKWRGETYPMLNIPYTKGSRFSFSERSLPLAAKIVDRLAGFLSQDRNETAFSFRENGKSLAATKTRIAKYMKKLGIPFPRWHACRHLLASMLLFLGAELENPINHLDACLVLGHTSQGDEPFHPAIRYYVYDAWEKYDQVVEKLLSMIGIED